MTRLCTFAILEKIIVDPLPSGLSGQGKHESCLLTRVAKRPLYSIGDHYEITSSMLFSGAIVG